MNECKKDLHARKTVGFASLTGYSLIWPKSAKATKTSAKRKEEDYTKLRESLTFRSVDLQHRKLPKSKGSFGFVTEFYVL